MERPQAEPLSAAEVNEFTGILLNERWIIMNGPDAEMVHTAHNILCQALLIGDVPWKPIETALAMLGFTDVL